jgi:hypothetical protein
MSLEAFIEKIHSGEPVSFTETMAVIADNYHYQPSKFSNGIGDRKLINGAGNNEGSCKIFAFAQIHKLTPQQTLKLFGEYYHRDVLMNPDGNNHQNIRNFMEFGWEGIDFEQPALTHR